MREFPFKIFENIPQNFSNRMLVDSVDEIVKLPLPAIMKLCKILKVASNSLKNCVKFFKNCVKLKNYENLLKIT